MPVTVWKGQLTFGLVSIPVRIIRAARQERVRFTQVYRPQPHEEEEEEEPAPPPPPRGRRIEPLPTPVEAPRFTPREPEPAVERVQRQYTAPDTGEAVAPHDLLKGYEYSKGRFAVF